MKQNLNKKGFTLIELLVVIAIIGILAAITVVSVQGPRNKANDTKSLANLRQVASVMEQYAGDNTTYPVATTWPALETAVAAYGTPLPSGTYLVQSSSTGYCVSADTADTGNTEKVRCRTGAQCATITAALATAEGC